MLRRTVLAVICLALAACVSTYVDPSDPGPPPKDPVAIVKRWAGSELRNVTQVTEVDVTKPEVGSFYQRPVIQKDKVVCWVADASFHAKTQLGVSRGRMRYKVFIRDGEVVNSRLLP